MKPEVRIGLADPFGAALWHYYAHGSLKAEGDSITEGIGQGRITANLEGLDVDMPYRIPDAEAVEQVFALLREEGLCLGASSGMNVAGAVRMARDLGPGHLIVTVLCDVGTRYQSKLFNPAFLRVEEPAGALLAGAAGQRSSPCLGGLTAAPARRPARAGAARAPRAGRAGRRPDATARPPADELRRRRGSTR